MFLTGAVSRWLRNKPSGSITTWEDLKTKFLRKYCPPARIAKKIEEINNFQQEPDETLYQAWERFKELLMKCPQHYLTDMQEVILFYNRLEVLTRQILDFKTAIPRQEVLKLLMDWLPSKHNLIILEEKSSRRRQATIPFPSRLYDGCYDEENGTYRLKDLDAYSNRATLLNDSLPQKEKDPGSFTLPCYINNICFEKALADLGASVSIMPLSTYLNLGLDVLDHTKLTVELADRMMKHPKGIAENVLVGIGMFVFLVDLIILDMPGDINVPLIHERPFLFTTHAKIDVFKRNITLRVGDGKIIFKSVKPASSLIMRVYMLSLIERMELDLEARLTGETLILNRSLDPLYGDYIKLNDLNEPLGLRRNQVDDLEPTIEECEVVDKPMFNEVKTRNGGNMVSKINGYPSYYDFDKKIHTDCAYNLQFLCMIGFDL
ncbi:hypothetical protein Tco_0135146 [Tanacetum coccineum]